MTLQLDVTKSHTEAWHAHDETVSRSRAADQVGLSKCRMHLVG